MTVSRQSSSSDLWFFIFALAGSVVAFALALISGALSLLSFLLGPVDVVPQPVWWFVTFGFLSLAGMPAIVFGIRSLRGLEDVHRPISRAIVLIPIIAFPMALSLGYFSFNLGVFPNILGSAAQILAAIGSSTFVISLIQKHTPAISKRRLWGQFTIGLWAVPFLAILGEVILFLPILLLFVLGALGSSEGRAILELLSDPSSSATSITASTSQLISMPWVLVLVFVFVSLLVPLLEEALKTLVIWPLLKRGLSPGEAFLGGVIGGASFGLVEAILLSQAAEAWLVIMAARAGATLMHSFTSGIAAWGLAEGFVRKRWDRLLIGYLVAVAFHGIWNALAVGAAILEIAGESESVSREFLVQESVLPLAIVALIAIALLGLPLIARRVAHQIAEV